MTVKITKPSINVREKLSELDKETGIKGEELMRADTSAEAREALQLNEQLFTDFESTGIDDNATSTAMTLDANGNLLVGKTASDFGVTAGIELNGQYDIGYFTRSDDKPLAVNRLSSDGSITDFRKNGTTVGSIGVAGSGTQPYFVRSGLGGIKIGIDGGTSLILPCDATGNSDDGGADLGYSNARFKDLYLSGGVYLGGTGAANLLDDYEEGTWTPIFQNVTVTYSVQSGTYTKVGNLVTCSGTITAAYIDNTDASSFAISGLPFSVQTNSFSSGTFNVPYNTTTRLLNTTARNVTGLSVDGATAYASDASEQNYERYTDICNASGTVYFTFTYRTA